MMTLTIRNLDDALAGKLRLQQALEPATAKKGFGSRIHDQVVARTGGFDLPLPPRSPLRDAPDFGDVS